MCTREGPDLLLYGGSVAGALSISKGERCNQQREDIFRPMIYLEKEKVLSFLEGLYPPIIFHILFRGKSYACTPC